VGREITSILDIDVLLPRVVETIREAFGYYHVQVFLVERDAERAGAAGQQRQQELGALPAGSRLASINAKAAHIRRGYIGQ
jgi:hypothetical protein